MTTHFRHKFVYTFLFVGVISTANGQLDSIELPETILYQLESYIENTELETTFDFNTLYETLATYLQNPLNLNSATQEELEQLGLLQPAQIYNLLDYRKQNGDLIAIYELQAVPNFDLSTIYRLLPFVKVGRRLDDLNEKLETILGKSKKDLHVLWSRTLEIPKGFQISNKRPTPIFSGDINKYYVRYKQQYENRVSLGITLEKDAGEAFFRGSNPQGFDFMSLHFMYKNVNAKIDRFVLGDFKAYFGQGLILNTGFSPGKGAFVTNIQRSDATFNRFTSVNEQNYLRGAGITLKLGKQLRWSNFTSFRRRDGKNVGATFSETAVDAPNFTSLQFSGLHRTEAEIASENTLEQFSLGSSLHYKTHKAKVGLNLLYNNFYQTIGKSTALYNQYFFRDNQLVNASIDYNFFHKNFIFFGETAWSDNHRFANLHGIMATLNSKVSIALQTRFFPRAFHSLFGQTFSETNGVNNENGLYLGVQIQPHARWSFAAYADTWRHPWLRFRADAPSHGQAYFARLTFYKKRDLETYIHWKHERKQQSYRFDYSLSDELLYKTKTNLRFHIRKQLNASLELRSRLEWSIFDIESGVNPTGLIYYNGAFRPQSATKSQGFMAYQDLLYRPTQFPLSITTRFAIFNIDNYDARIYTYENDVSFQFSIPAYYNKGSRFYAILKYHTKKHLTLEARFAQTYWANQLQFGSGPNQIDGQTRSSIKIQVKWRF